MLTNKEIIEIYLKDDLIKRCMKYQFVNMNDWFKYQYFDDLYQDILLALLTYDNKKLNNTHENNHMNALITRIIQNNIYSNSSRFYTTYIKYAKPDALRVNIDKIIEQEDYGDDED